jgi:hypothetical protein
MSFFVDAGVSAARFVTLTNAAGVAGIALGASWALLGRRSTILLCQTIGALCFALHFFLLGSLAGSIMCLAGSVQSAAARLCLGRGTLMACYALTLAAAGGVGIATAHGLPALLAALGLVFATIGRLQESTQRMRLAFLACTGAWAVHNFMVGSVIGNVSDALTAIGILAGLWTHRQRDAVGVVAGGRQRLLVQPR